VDVVLIEYPERLVRFHFGYLEQALSWQDVRLEVLDPPEHQEPTEELIEDLLTIVTVFAGQIVGHQAKGLRKRARSNGNRANPSQENAAASSSGGMSVDGTEMPLIKLHVLLPMSVRNILAVCWSLSGCARLPPKEGAKRTD
jgi:hypothetical protein